MLNVIEICLKYLIIIIIGSERKRRKTTLNYLHKVANINFATFKHPILSLSFLMDRFGEYDVTTIVISIK